MRGGPPGQLGILFHYAPGRGGTVAKHLLENFAGYLQTDGYAGYREVCRSERITGVGCMAHARRKFTDALKALPKAAQQKKTGRVHKALAFFEQLYQIERGHKDATPEARRAARQEKAKPILARFKAWLDRQSIPPQSLLGKAIGYALTEWPRLIVYLDDGRINIDNNLVENAIRPFAIGRKSWLFSATQDGATASANLYSLVAIRTALRQILLFNGLLRFPLVAAYCLLGLGLAAYALENPAFTQSLPLTDAGEPNYNLVFPAFVLAEFSPGLTGLAIVGLFAAAMSSIDSALNSLSASSLEDFLGRSKDWSEKRRFYASKLLTLAWGVFALAFSFSVEHIAPTILEAINKIGSLANGPLLALFVVATVLPRTPPKIAIGAFLLAVGLNGYLWLFVPDISWLWWNVIGCLLVLFVAALWRMAIRVPENGGISSQDDRPGQFPVAARSTAWLLASGFGAILLCLLVLQCAFAQR